MTTGGTAKGKLRVLHCFGGMGLGGAETFVMHVYRSVAREELQFDFAVSARTDGYYDDEIKNLGGRIIRHTPPAEAGFRRYAAELRNILRRDGPFDAIHSHLYYFSGYVLRIAALEHVPARVAHVHCTRDGRSGTLSGLAYHAAMRGLIKRNATHILGCSRGALASMFGKGWDSDSRMSVVRNGIALAPYAAICRRNKEDLRQELSIPNGNEILGHLGRFDEVKNHRYLIEIFRRYLDKGHKATLVLIGDGGLRREIERQVEAIALGEHVRFLGKRPQTEVPQLLGAFDVLVMPSLNEGLPVTLVEAQAAGVPCVISDAITREADLGLGLLRFVSLKAGGEEWCEQIMEALRMERPDWDTRKRAIQESGYDISSSADALSRIYQSAHDLHFVGNGR